MKDEDYRRYIDMRNAIYEVVKKSEDIFESRMITIGSGALGISFTMLPFICRSGVYLHKYMIAVAWGLIVLSIIINLWSHVSSKIKAKNAIKELDEMVINDKPYNSKDINAIINSKNKGTEFWNITSLITLIAGIIGICIFAFTNFSQDKKQNDMEKTTQEKNICTAALPDVDETLNILTDFDADSESEILNNPSLEDMLAASSEKISSNIGFVALGIDLPTSGPDNPGSK